MHTLFVFLFLLLIPQQHQHPSNQAPAGKSAEAAHHAFLEQERAALERGEGFGMALAADRNGYPGPKHILELKSPLKLTAQQETAVQQVMARMKERAIARGREILNAEARLEEMFRQGRPEAELREETYRIASLRAELRWVHLNAHLQARRLLTPEQLAAYHNLRHGTGAHQQHP
jgi:hypothetical protein